MSVDWNQVEWYSRTRGPVESGPSVTINKSGRVVLNEEALNTFGEWPQAFQVGVVKGGRGKVVLVLQAAAKGDAGALTLTNQGRKFSLNTPKFLTKHGLTSHFGTNRSLKPEFDEQHNAMLVSL